MPVKNSRKVNKTSRIFHSRFIKINTIRTLKVKVSSPRIVTSIIPIWAPKHWNWPTDHNNTHFRSNFENWLTCPFNSQTLVKLFDSRQQLTWEDSYQKKFSFSNLLLGCIGAFSMKFESWLESPFNCPTLTLIHSRQGDIWDDTFGSAKGKRVEFLEQLVFVP